MVTVLSSLKWDQGPEISLSASSGDCRSCCGWRCNSENELSFKKISGHITPKPTVKGDFGLNSLTIGPDSSSSDVPKLSGCLQASETSEDLCVNAVVSAEVGAVLIPHFLSSEDRTDRPVDTRTQTGALNMPLSSAAWSFSKAVFSPGLPGTSSLLTGTS